METRPIVLRRRPTEILRDAMRAAPRVQKRGTIRFTREDLEVVRYAVNEIGYRVVGKRADAIMHKIDDALAGIYIRRAHRAFSRVRNGV